MSDETPTAETEAPSQEDAPKPESFSLEYVQELRNQAAKYRTEKKAAADNAKAEVIKEYEGRLTEKEQSFGGLREELETTNLE